MVSDPFRTRPAGVSTKEEILLRRSSGACRCNSLGRFCATRVRLLSELEGSVKTRPASAARPSLPDRTCKLFLASLFQGVAKRNERLLSERINPAQQLPVDIDVQLLA